MVKLSAVGNDGLAICMRVMAGSSNGGASIHGERLVKAGDRANMSHSEVKSDDHTAFRGTDRRWGRCNYVGMHRAHLRSRQSDDPASIED